MNEVEVEPMRCGNSGKILLAIHIAIHILCAYNTHSFTEELGPLIVTNQEEGAPMRHGDSGKPLLAIHISCDIHL